MSDRKVYGTFEARSHSGRGGRYARTAGPRYFLPVSPAPRSCCVCHAAATRSEVEKPFPAHAIRAGGNEAGGSCVAAPRLACRIGPDLGDPQRSRSRGSSKGGRSVSTLRLLSRDHRPGGGCRTDGRGGRGAAWLGAGARLGESGAADRQEDFPCRDPTRLGGTGASRSGWSIVAEGQERLARFRPDPGAGQDCLAGARASRSPAQCRAEGTRCGPRDDLRRSDSVDDRARANTALQALDGTGTTRHLTYQVRPPASFGRSPAGPVRGAGD